MQRPSGRTSEDKVEEGRCGVLGTEKKMQAEEEGSWGQTTATLWGSLSMEKLMNILSKGIMERYLIQYSVTE